jgi:hypothetical protein
MEILYIWHLCGQKQITPAISSCMHCAPHVLGILWSAYVYLLSCNNAAGLLDGRKHVHAILFGTMERHGARVI